MADDGFQQASDARVACEVTWHRPVDVTVAARGAACAVEYLLDDGELFDLEFRIVAGGGLPLRVAWVVGGIDRTHATRMAELVRTTIASFSPWCGLGPIVAVDDIEPLEAADTIHDLVERPGPPPLVSHAFAPSWKLAQRCDTRVEMVMRLRHLDVTADRPVKVHCGIEVRGSAADAAAVAGALAADTPSETRLGIRRRTAANGPAWLELPQFATGWLVSTPARIQDRWPTAELVDAGKALEMILSATPPHLAVFGGSGLGKTTLGEHVIDAAAARGETLVVLCRHGDLPARAAQILQRQGIAFDAIDFGNRAAPPRWSVLQPPSAVPLDAWLPVIPNIILARWREKHDLDGQMAGPMWHQALTPANRIAAADPDGPLPITRLGELFAAELDPRWRRIAAANDLLDTLNQLQNVRAAIHNDKERHFLPWITSKLSVFTSTDAMRNLTSHRASSFDLTRLLDGRSLLIAAPRTLLGDDGASVALTGILEQIRALVMHHPLPAGHVIRVVIDEAHLVDPNLPDWFYKEGRKFGIAVTVLTQSPRALSDSLLTSVMTNTGAIATFRVGPADAAVLDQRFPTVTTGTMQRLPPHTVAVTDGQRDLVCVAPPPCVDPHDRSVFDDHHHHTLAAAASTTGIAVVNDVPTPVDTEQGDQREPNVASAVAADTFTETLRQALRE